VNAPAPGLGAARGAALGAVLLAAGCAAAPRAHVGPVTGRASAGGRTFTCSQAGLFVDDGDGLRLLCVPGLRPFALAAGDGGLLVGGGVPAQSGELALCSLDGRVQRRARVADDLVYGVALARGGEGAAAACADGRVLRVLLPDLAAAERWRHGGAALAVAFAPDGALLASGGVDGIVLVGAPTGDDAPRPLADHTAAVTCLCWSADGQRLASGARDGKVRLHDRDGRLLYTWQRLGGPVEDVAFTAAALQCTVGGSPGAPARGLTLELP